MGSPRPARSAKRRAAIVVALAVAASIAIALVAGPPFVRARIAAKLARVAERHGVRATVDPAGVEVSVAGASIALHGLEVTAFGVEGTLDVALDLGSWLDLLTSDLGREAAVFLRVGPGKLRVRSVAASAPAPVEAERAEGPPARDLPRVSVVFSELDVETPAGWLRDVRGSLQPSFELPITLTGWITLDAGGTLWAGTLAVTGDEVRITTKDGVLGRVNVPGLGPVDIGADDVTLAHHPRMASVRGLRATAGSRELRAALVTATLGAGALLVAATGVAVDDGQEQLPFTASRLDLRVSLGGDLTTLVVPRLDATLDWEAVAPFVRAHLGGLSGEGSALSGPERGAEAGSKLPTAIQVQSGRVEIAGAGLAISDLTIDAGRDHLDLAGALSSDERAEGTVAVAWRAGAGSPATLRIEVQGCLPPAPWRALLAENGLTISPGCQDALRLDAVLGEPDVTFAGTLAVAAWTVQEAHLATGSMADIGFDAAFDGRLRRDLTEGVVRLTSFASGPLTLSGALSATRLRDKPIFDLRLEVPTQACDNLLRALPEAMRPDLPGLWLGGTFRLGLHYTVDLARVYAMFDARLAGREEPYTSPLELVGENMCEVTSRPRDIDIEALNRADFVHRVELEDGRVVEVGPGTSRYVPLAELPPSVVHGALATEDLSFYAHRGVNPGLLKTALEMDLHAGRFKYGGSTITQQLVKNLYLSRTKTIARKIEDILLALYVETVVSKDRLLELYLNVIEFGDGVYGIGNASLVYFGKEPRELLPEEAAFLMTCKPAPPDCQRLLDRGAVTPTWRGKVDYVLERLYRRVKVIDEKEYRDALTRELRFLGSGGGAAAGAAPARDPLELLP